MAGRQRRVSRLFGEEDGEDAPFPRGDLAREGTKAAPRVGKRGRCKHQGRKGREGKDREGNAMKERERKEWEGRGRKGKEMK